MKPSGGCKTTNFLWTMLTFGKSVTEIGLCTWPSNFFVQINWTIVDCLKACWHNDDLFFTSKCGAQPNNDAQDCCSLVLLHFLFSLSYLQAFSFLSPVQKMHIHLCDKVCPNKCLCVFAVWESVHRKELGGVGMRPQRVKNTLKPLEQERTRKKRRCTSIVPTIQQLLFKDCSDADL